MIPPLATTASLIFQDLTELADRLERGDTSSGEIVRGCLDQIDRLDDKVQAWVMVNHETAMQLANESDERRRDGSPLSRLDGIPVGIKDIIDVAGWPTVAGFAPWKRKPAKKDAGIVAKIRAAGMIPLGKTVTTQFASIDPPVTRNPWNLDRTPGGSSSGSCAAVACRMVPLALGSQTGGSINRPASFCGVVGLKMTYGEWKTEGVVPCSPGLDTLGPIVPSVRDIKLVYDAIPGAFDSEKHRSAFEKIYQTSLANDTKIVCLGGKFRDLADTEMQETIQKTARILKTAGFQVEFQDGSDFFNDDLWATHRSLMMVECYLTHQKRFGQFEEFYLPKIRSWVEEGRKIEMTQSDDDFHAIYIRRGQLVRDFQKRFSDFDLLLTPAARGPAPTPETTGDPVFNAPWTLLCVPSLTLPVRLSADGLPLGVQLAPTSIGAPGFGRLLATAELLERKCHEGSDTR